jgi:uncharacterized membrane protein
MDTQTQTSETKHDKRSHAITSIKAKANAKRSLPEKFADWLTGYFGTVTFLVLNALWFTGWILVNTGKIPGIEPFDRFPFGLLTMIVSLEAIFLAIIVLISQNREAKIAELREEIDLQVNSIAEEEISKTIRLMLLLLKKQGVHVERDPELQRILGIKKEDIERELELELSTKNDSNFLKDSFNKVKDNFPGPGLH